MCAGMKMQASWTLEREEVTLEKSKFLLLGTLDLLRVCPAVHCWGRHVFWVSCLTQRAGWRLGSRASLESSSSATPGPCAS